MTWYVRPLGPNWWWQNGRWTKNPDQTKHYSNMAHPKTKVGAWRIANKCPVPTEIVCRKPSCRKWPKGYEKIWHIKGKT